MNKAIFFFLFAFTTIGCSEQRKINKAKDVLSKNPVELARLCNDKFPIQEKVTYLPGRIVFDTLYLDNQIVDSVDCPPSDTTTRIEIRIKYKDRLIKESKVDTLVKEIPDLYKVMIESNRADSLQKIAAAQADTIYTQEGKLAKKNESIFWLVVLCLAMLAWISRKLWIPAIAKIFTLITKYFGY